MDTPSHPIGTPAMNITQTYNLHKKMELMVSVRQLEIKREKKRGLPPQERYVTLYIHDPLYATWKLYHIAHGWDK